jgi:hypothetical protein
VSNPKPLPNRHTPATWYVHAHYKDHKLAGVEIKSLVAKREILAGDDLEQDLIDADRIMRCVNACELLRTDHPDREIEELLRYRDLFMKIVEAGKPMPSETMASHAPTGIARLSPRAPRRSMAWSGAQPRSVWSSASASSTSASNAGTMGAPATTKGRRTASGSTPS